MVSIPGSIGKTDNLFIYLIGGEIGPAPAAGSNATKRPADLNDNVLGHIQFPVSVPGIDMSTLNTLLNDSCSPTKLDYQGLEVNWNYDAIYGTIVASMHVFPPGSNDCIVSHDCMLTGAKFKEKATEKIEDSEQLFVAIAYAAKHSLLTTYNMKITPAHNGIGLNLQAEIILDVGRAKEQNALSLIKALSRNINVENFKLDERPFKKSKKTAASSSSSIPLTMPSTTSPSITSPSTVSSLIVSSSTVSSAEPLLISHPIPSQPQTNTSRELHTPFTTPPNPVDASLSAFYANLHPVVSSEYLEQYTSPEIASLLTPFQTQNVRWMIEREGHSATDTGEIIQLPQNHRPLPLLYTGTHTDDTSGVYYDMYRKVESTNRAEIEKLTDVSLKGGILADEMGLGKTVSVLGLITKHQLNINDPSHPSPSKFPTLTVSKATLIIAPCAIMSQWASEIRKHTPDLTVYEYAGVVDDPIDAESLSKYDIVLVFYETFRTEIAHSQAPPKRSRRYAVKYEFAVSPLVSILWFRCVLDEAQMVETVTGNVAKMANMIPRWYSWAVTGTPLKKGFNELFGLYNFIQPDKYISRQGRHFDNLVLKPENKGLFFEYTKATMRRNTKAALTSQVVIPKQTRHVVHIPFSTIEQHYYEDLYRRCKYELKFDWMDSIGWELPANASDTNKAIFSEIKSKMRPWLLALRQNCIHPSVIANMAYKLGNLSTLVANGRKVQSMTDVLKDMETTASTTCDNNQYSFYNVKLTRGGMYEVMHDWQKAYDIYKSSIPEMKILIQSCAKKIRSLSDLDEEAIDDDEGKKDKSTSAGWAYHRWNLLLHRYYHYLAEVCHKLNLNEEEEIYQSQASDIRLLLLEKYNKKLKVAMCELGQSGRRMKSRDEHYVGARAIEEDLLKFKDYSEEESDDNDEGYGDTKERDRDVNMLQNLKQIGDVLDKQYERILYLRNEITKLLETPVIDNSTVEDTTGDMFDDIVKEQSSTQSYITAYQNLLQDRKFIIRGTLNASSLVTKNYDEFESDESVQIDAAEINFRKSLRSPGFQIECIKDLERFLRTLKTTMKGCESEQEYLVLDENQQWLKKHISIQNKLVDDMESDVRRISQAFNNRLVVIDYLQKISDTLVYWRHINPQSEIKRLSSLEATIQRDIINSQSRDLYFKALAEEHKNLKNPDEKITKDCLICEEPIEKGMITYCGHVSCNDCGLIWFNRNQRCHTCNSPVRHNEWYNVSYKEMEMRDKDARSNDNNNKSTSSCSDEDNEKSREQLNTLIQNINTVNIIPGQGAKLDSIIRHIKFIKNESNGKCVVFSQWVQVLEMLNKGLNINGVKCVTLNKGANNSDIVSSFQKDENINVILLHARSQSSGLTLIEAQTVFIVEPVFNESLEKQAINRVHRIGQTKETSVFWYIVQDTIEERIQAIHDRKRNLNNVDIDDDLALSKLTDGGGEVVADDDIRLCFTSNENVLIGNI
ncbi:SNF2 family N-terminal domain-containing protein [Mucor mucedo]|uniref:SNF2 family N-terminal domain-containing protein n=1 Tax=Mucor mucedo TaxID=29922 RepID=UPI002220711C|nr:SNF2 family N-terminal domain-containing protein [Mucor mucedo]KAI7887884.1 SNF2 family N-terminal domain-containing protein [Mucor mucedo]